MFEGEEVVGGVKEVVNREDFQIYLSFISNPGFYYLYQFILVNHLIIIYEKKFCISL
jgi:hypothetical protein